MSSSSDPRLHTVLQMHLDARNTEDRLMLTIGDTPAAGFDPIQKIDSMLHELPKICQNLLEAQTKMLLFSKELEKTDKGKHEEKFGGRAYEGLIVNHKPTYDKEKTKIDFYDSDTQSISICPYDKIPRRNAYIVNESSPKYLFHEMIHALDDIYEDRKSSERVLAIFDPHPKPIQDQIIKSVATVLMPTQDDFIKGYCNPVLGDTDNKMSLSELNACADKKNIILKKIEEMKGPTELSTGAESELSVHETSHIENNASRLPMEFVSFAYEVMFDEIINPSATGKPFLQRFAELRPAEGDASAEPDHIKKLTQEALAVSMYDINNHMLEYYRSVESEAVSKALEDSPIYQSYKMLSEIETTLKPIYEGTKGKIEAYNTKKLLCEEEWTKEAESVASAFVEKHDITRTDEKLSSKKRRKKPTGKVKRKISDKTSPDDPGGSISFTSTGKASDSVDTTEKIELISDSSRRDLSQRMVAFMRSCSPIRSLSSSRKGDELLAQRRNSASAGKTPYIS